MFSFLKNSTASFFHGGVHPDEHKEKTAHLPIEELPTPKEVHIPLIQHIGAPTQALVKRGDLVKRGQVIGEVEGMGVPIHATICGKVAKVAKLMHPILVTNTAIVIKSQEPEDGVSSLNFDEDPNWMKLDKTEMLKRIRDAGIVGLGGATFPTYRKLTLPENVAIDTLIINGAECEPYLTTDHRMMLEMAKQIVLGAWLIAKIIGVKRCLFGIEDNKRDAAEAINLAIIELNLDDASFPVNMKACITHTRYPQGSEKQLIQALTGRNVPARSLPLHVGIVVQNVATAAACLDAIRYRKPLLDRVITVSGEGIQNPKNIRAPIGTPLSKVVEACGGMSEEVIKIIHGGPMMGRALPSLDIPVIKGTNGLLFLTPKETYLGSYDPCIQCASCLDACPLGLEPNRISIYVESGQPLETEKYGTLECFECGCCSYVCPSKRPLVQFIQVSKAAFNRQLRLNAQNETQRETQNETQTETKQEATHA